jgi:hypothetical protein
MRFVTCIAGTGVFPQEGFQFCFACDAAATPVGAFVDFCAEPAMLELRFTPLHFAQRVARRLLPNLGLAMLLGMWNVAEQRVIEAMGAALVPKSPDLVAWELLRQNFAGNHFSITVQELQALQKKVEALAR